jgi:hypothetical protein
MFGKASSLPRDFSNLLVEGPNIPDPILWRHKLQTRFHSDLAANNAFFDPNLKK